MELYISALAVKSTIKYLLVQSNKVEFVRAHWDLFWSFRRPPTSGTKSKQPTTNNIKSDFFFLPKQILFVCVKTVNLSNCSQHRCLNVFDAVKLMGANRGEESAGVRLLCCCHHHSLSVKHNTCGNLTEKNACGLHVIIGFGTSMAGEKKEKNDVMAQPAKMSIGETIHCFIRQSTETKLPQLWIISNTFRHLLGK